MGQIFSQIYFSVFRKPQKYTSLMLGLDNAGKTIILYKLLTGKTVKTIPTIGFNIEKIAYENENINIVIWDLRGLDKSILFWEHYYNLSQNGLIFVIDANDRERIGHASIELNKLLNVEELKNAAILIFANKTDIPDAMTQEELINELKIDQAKYTGRRIHLQRCSGFTGKGLQEGMKWFVNELKKNKYIEQQTEIV